MSAGSPVRPGRRVRLARLARQLSQQQLADAAGVTRQAVAGVEAGRFDPSLRVALRLATALGVPVEELFGTGAGPSAVRAAVVSVPVAQAGQRLETGPLRAALATVGGRVHAYPLIGDAAAVWGFRPATGLVDALPAPVGPEAQAPDAIEALPEAEVRIVGDAGRTVVVAGCDPALPLLAGPLSRLEPPMGLLWVPCSSTRALQLLASGAVHVAGAHLRDDGGTYNARRVRELLGDRGAAVVGFGSWSEGLAVAPAVASGVAGLHDVARAGLRIVNREPGAEARAVLDRERLRCRLGIEDLPGWDTVVGGHLQVAAAIAGGLADAGITCEPAARTYGLGFVPLTAERFDLVVARRQVAAAEVAALLGVLGGDELRGQLSAIPGYDATECGNVVEGL